LLDELEPRIVAVPPGDGARVFDALAGAGVTLKQVRTVEAPRDHARQVPRHPAVAGYGGAAIRRCERPTAAPLVTGEETGQDPGHRDRVPSDEGRSAVVVPVPDVEPVVSMWRERFDSSAAEGMPAHITLLYPFLHEDRLTDEVVAWLRELCADVPVLAVQFTRTKRFPGVLYLDPEPAGRLRGLTAAIAQRWPDAPPYGGRFDEVIPHLTVARAADDDVLDEVESEVLSALPVATRLLQACVYVFDGARWRPRERLPFQSR
jgi:2'-5' RNA ligase